MPTVLPQWATDDIQDPVSGQFNVVEPPDEIKLDGWDLGEKPNRQFWNWFNRQTYLFLQWLVQQQNLNVTSNNAGIGLYTVDNALITIKAVDLGNLANYYQATGIKISGSVPQFVAATIQSNGLTLGTGTIGGNQPISGGSSSGANIVIYATSSVIPV